MPRAYAALCNTVCNVCTARNERTGAPADACYNRANALCVLMGASMDSRHMLAGDAHASQLPSFKGDIALALRAGQRARPSRAWTLYN